MFRHILPAVGCVVLTASLATASTYRGPSFVEPGDAGNGRDDAVDVKNPDGTGSINSISGSLTGGGLLATDGDYQDVYRIFIKDPLLFKIQLSNEATNHPDSMMFLFDELGHPLMASDNTSSQNFNPILENQGGQFFNHTGVFYLAITSAPSEAQAIQDGVLALLFNLGEFPFGTVGPLEGAQSAEWFDQWTPPTNPDHVGDYFMLVDGVESMPNVPSPAGLALLGLAGVLGGRRRRR
ncbi:MAG: MYXO-CTERM sorting domain-containing protein [Planctomycetota bacterium]|nr:MYXO-CTERM sorting domain-containing protein [Planctomycetota bacterium]